jgi:hypothetical protein
MACAPVLVAQAWRDAMDVMEAIYNRRLRAYTDQPVDKSTIEALIKAATHAPSSMNEQPWAFAVIQNPTQLAVWSDRIKGYVLKHLNPDSPLTKYREMISSSDYCQAKSRHSGRECAGVPRRRGLSEREDAPGSTAGAGNPCLAVGSGCQP